MKITVLFFLLQSAAFVMAMAMFTHDPSIGWFWLTFITAWIVWKMIGFMAIEARIAERQRAIAEWGDA